MKNSAKRSMRVTRTGTIRSPHACLSKPAAALMPCVRIPVRERVAPLAFQACDFPISRRHEHRLKGEEQKTLLSRERKGVTDREGLPEYPVSTRLKTACRLSALPPPLPPGSFAPAENPCANVSPGPEERRFRACRGIRATGWRRASRWWSCRRRG